MGRKSCASRSLKVLCGVVSFIAFVVFLSVTRAQLTKPHPCGLLGNTVETANHFTNLLEWGWPLLPGHVRQCAFASGNRYFPNYGYGELVPPHRLSYMRAAWSVLTSIQVRYMQDWRNAASVRLEEALASHHLSWPSYVSTGTAALTVAMQTMGVGPNDEVIVPASAEISIASAVINSWGIPVFVDIDESLSMDPAKVRAAITNRTKAVIVQHMWGSVAKAYELRKLCDEHNIFLVEDCSHSFSATSLHVGDHEDRENANRVGFYGHFGTISVNPSRTLSSGGQGGIVWMTMHDAELGDRLQWAIENGLSLHGGLQNLPSYVKSYGRPAVPKIDKPYAMWCFRAPSEWHAAFLRTELEKVKGTTARLQMLRRSFTESLKTGTRSFLQAEQEGSRAYQIIFIFRTGQQCQSISRALRSALAEGLHKYRSPTVDDCECGCLTTSNMTYAPSFLPQVPFLRQKVPRHTSGHPWMTEKDRKPLNMDDFAQTLSILNRTMRLDVAWFWSRRMMGELARAVDAAAHPYLD